MAPGWSSTNLFIAGDEEKLSIIIKTIFPFTRKEISRPVLKLNSHCLRKFKKPTRWKLSSSDSDPTTATWIYEYIPLVPRVWSVFSALSPAVRDGRLWRVVGRESWLCKASELMLIMSQIYFLFVSILSQTFFSFFSQIKTNKWNGIGYSQRPYEIVCLEGIEGGLGQLTTNSKFLLPWKCSIGTHREQGKAMV